jgi:hypothetical protein
MKNYRKKLLNLFSKKDLRLLQEELSNKSHSREEENMGFNNKLILLNLDFQRRYNDLMVWFKNEKKKLVIQHNQKLKSLDLQ